MNLGIQNKNALVCGSSQGIGKAAAIALAEEGANVTLLARNEEALKSVLQELPNNNQCHAYLVADFSNPDAVQKTVMDQGANYHILINNTGGPRSGLIQDATSEQFLNAFTMHLLVNQKLSQACLPFMKKEGFGRIVNVISTSVKEPIPGLGVSNTIRNAVANWAKTLSEEVASAGITVNNVLPGFTQTIRLDEIVGIKAQKAGTSEAQMEEIMKNYVPMKRFAKAEETAAAIAFLASAKASYITGVNVPVDGGRTKSL
ncbi:MAG: short-chain dehydrogenase [Flavobacteriaceae bacterium]|nr:short-chain dehydrogenase [Flavobacteriaceae bacterium]|tara:strand:- start:93026 stop:93802 length:777 start_codon:yes stop_codon:yes gene_type:complete